MSEGQKQNGSILNVTRADQYHTVEELFRKSEPNSVYYALLIISVFIIASGLLLGNSAIVIGGMLVTPLLTPILVIALSFIVGNFRAIRNTSIIMTKSFLLVIAVSGLLAFVFGAPKNIEMLENTMRTAVLYFIVAIAAGMAGTFAWTRKDVAEVLPGIAIAVSLVPPLALMGIWLSSLNFDAVRFSFLVFLFNFLGILVGSVAAFILMKFHRAERLIEEKAEIQVEEAAKKEK